eukprot:g19654.t1
MQPEAIPTPGGTPTTSSSRYLQSRRTSRRATGHQLIMLQKAPFREVWVCVCVCDPENTHTNSHTEWQLVCGQRHPCATSDRTAAGGCDLRPNGS